MTSVWDDPELRIDTDYVKFENVGDTIVGTIDGIGIHTWDDGRRCPKLFIVDDDGNSRTLTAGQYELKKKLAELRPEVGDRIAIKFVATDKLDGGKTAKRFTVQTKKGEAPAVADAASGGDAPGDADDLL